MSAKKTALDIAINCAEHFDMEYDEDGNSARAELAQLREKADECDKWRAWKPDDETLADMQQQDKTRDGSYSNGLAACSVYIGGLEAKLRELRAAAAERDELKRTVEAQAAQLEQAREVIGECFARYAESLPNGAQGIQGC